MEQRAFDWERERSIDERFATFCEDHPDVLRLFERFARELKAAGHEKGGAKLIAERIRWERLTSAHGAETPAINNDYTSRLSRWLVGKCPEFQGWFETRKLRNGEPNP